MTKSNEESLQFELILLQLGAEELRQRAAEIDYKIQVQIQAALTPPTVDLDMKPESAT